MAKLYLIGKRARITMPGENFGKVVKVLDCSSWVIHSALTSSRDWWRFWAAEHWAWEWLEPVATHCDRPAHW